jgi:hypothetical protein
VWNIRKKRRHQRTKQLPQHQSKSSRTLYNNKATDNFSSLLLTMKPMASPAAHPNEDFQSIKSTLLSLSSLQVATANFSESNKLGEGGFGAVYKVW